jgi:hypothetical protein
MPVRYQSRINGPEQPQVVSAVVKGFEKYDSIKTAGNALDPEKVAVDYFDFYARTASPLADQFAKSGFEIKRCNLEAKLCKGQSCVSPARPDVKDACSWRQIILRSRKPIALMCVPATLQLAV